MSAMNKKVGLAIVTYTINYGTFLQAFATQTAMRNLGCETEILNIDSVIADVSKARKKYFLKQMFNLAELKSYRHTISALIARKTDKTYKHFMAQREACFRAFHKKNFSIGPKCDSWDGLSEHCREFDSIVVGSDQLWRPANIAGNFYTLNFVPEDVNKISYATSFGLKEIRPEQRVAAARFLNRINYLSTREDSGADIVRDLTGRTAEVVCDPTLLLTKAEWESFLQPEPIVSGDYILVYMLSNFKEHRAYIRRLAKQTSCKVVGILHGAGYIKGDEKSVDEAPAAIDPFDFLNLIRHAKYVCTDSFHGCVFSTIMEKDYYVFKRFSDADKMSTNSRVTGLLQRLNLSHRIVTDYECIDLTPIDYTVVNERLDDFRNRSKRYLIGALRNE